MPLDSLVGTIQPLIWLGFGVVLLLLEMLAPGVFLLWLGLAALAVAATLQFAPLDLNTQFAVFAAVAVLLVAFARLVLRYGVSVTDRGILNKAGNRFTGQLVEVAEPIVAGRGKVKIGDSFWIAEGPDAAVGVRVRVKGSKGTVLLTELVA